MPAASIANIAQRKSGSRQIVSRSGTVSGGASYAGRMAKTGAALAAGEPAAASVVAAGATDAFATGAFSRPGIVFDGLVQLLMCSRAPLESEMNFSPQIVFISLVQTTSPVPSMRLWP